MEKIISYLDDMNPNYVFLIIAGIIVLIVLSAGGKKEKDDN